MAFNLTDDENQSGEINESVDAGESVDVSESDDSGQMENNEAVVRRMVVRPTAIDDVMIVESPRAELNVGEVRFRVDHFAFTANNVTYATTGSFLGYLDFFPVDTEALGIESDWRQIPAMGFGELVESAHPDVPANGRFFGFFPMSTEHVFQAGIKGPNLVDMGAHRANHAMPYRQFEQVGEGSRDRATEPSVALLRGLFFTSFLLEDFLFDNGFYGAETVVITSASSKTAIALGFCLTRRGIPSIGITSAKHVEALEELECYDRVLSYEDLDSIPSHIPTVLVDFAGNGEVLGRLHALFGENLRYSCMVGGTHRQSNGRPAELVGPTPQFFFAPTQIGKRTQDWGAAEVQRRIRESFEEFTNFSKNWMQVVNNATDVDVLSAYHEVVSGTSSPMVGHMMTLGVSEAAERHSGGHPDDPLHGVTLAMMLDELVEHYGWEELGQRVPIRCFTHDPSIGSSLKFLRRTPWARTKVERLYKKFVTKR